MGYDVNRFEGDVDEELICPICSFILEDPVQVGSCSDKIRWYFKKTLLFVLYIIGA